MSIEKLKQAHKLISESITELESEKALEDKIEPKEIEKISTGVRRIDDLLYGGLPKRSSIFVYGPPFTGKQTLLNLFIAGGLKNGIPCTYILTNESVSDAREKLELVIPAVGAHEETGLLKFIDIYSKGMGFKANEPNVIYVDANEFYKSSEKAYEILRKRLEDVGKQNKGHKLVLNSVSTIMAYSEPMSTFKFLHSFIRDSKNADTTAMYSLDAGMFRDSEVQTLKHLMNGMVETKTEDLKTYMRIEGITDARTRGWIEYSHYNRSISLKGSFAVDHIR